MKVYCVVDKNELSLIRKGSTSVSVQFMGNFDIAEKLRIVNDYRYKSLAPHVVVKCEIFPLEDEKELEEMED